jgi:hypothetical protein
MKLGFIYTLFIFNTPSFTVLGVAIVYNTGYNYRNRLTVIIYKGKKMRVTEERYHKSLAYDEARKRNALQQIEQLKANIVMYDALMANTRIKLKMEQAKQESKRGRPKVEKAPKQYGWFSKEDNRDITALIPTEQRLMGCGHTDDEIITYFRKSFDMAIVKRVI